MSDNRIIREHEGIWREFHEPLFITLARSKADWLALLDDDPQMLDRLSWGTEMAGTTTWAERAEFRAWLSEESR